MHPLQRQLLVRVLVILGVLLILLLRRHMLRDWWRYARIHFVRPDDLQLVKYQDKPRVPTPRRTIVSLTTIPSRIDKCFRALYALLDQTHRVDEIVINVPRVSRKGAEYVVPRWLRCLSRTNPVVRIHRCETDLGPITKLVPTLERYRAEHVNIIVVDDDVIYKRRHLYHLCQLARDYPRHAITGTGYRVHNKDGSKREYRSFGVGLKQVDVLMGVSGYLVYNRMFDDDFFAQIAQQPHEYTFVDDDVISLYLLRKQIPIVSMKYAAGLSCPEFTNFIRMLFNYQSDALCRTANKPSSGGWFGENETKILADHGMYLTQWQYFKFYFF